MSKPKFLETVQKAFCGFKNTDESSEKKRVNPIIICAIIAAILVLIFFKPSGGAKKNVASSEPAAEVESDTEYAKRMEDELKGILEKISGAGSVSVRIYIDSTNEKILAEDSRASSEITESGDSKKETSSKESQPASASGGGFSGSGGEPYVVREKLPYPIGVVVVASGASDSGVRNEIYEAVKALYGLSANRIKVTY